MKLENIFIVIIILLWFNIIGWLIAGPISRNLGYLTHKLEDWIDSIKAKFNRY